MKILTPNPYVVYKGYQIIPSYCSTWKCMNITFKSVQSAKQYINELLDHNKIKK